MAKDFFDIDPKNKLGADTPWEDGDEFSAFVDALNRGVTVRPDVLQGMADSQRENELDAVALAELRARFSQYQ